MKNRFNSQETNTNKKPQTTREPRPEPVYDQFQKDIAEVLYQQVETFVEARKDIENMDFGARRDSEKALFALAAYPDVLENHNDLYLYMVNRSVRIDRESHMLTRAGCTIIVLDQATGNPKYLVDAFLNANGGSISVVPQTKEGPDVRNTYRKSIKF